MQRPRQTLRTLAKWILVATAVAVVGRCAVISLDYYREARIVRALAEGLEDVQVLEVDGNHDLTLESIWLLVRFQGEYLCFENVTPESFDEVSSLQVSRIGGWRLATLCFREDVIPPEGDNCWDPNSKVRCHAWGSVLDFGEDGDVGRSIDPPIRSIPEFLQRLPEVRSIIDQLPTMPPGKIVASTQRRISTSEGTVERAPVSIWAYRTAALGPWEE